MVGQIVRSTKRTTPAGVAQRRRKELTVRTAVDRAVEASRCALTTTTLHEEGALAQRSCLPLRRQTYHLVLITAVGRRISRRPRELPRRSEGQQLRAQARDPLRAAGLHAQATVAAVALRLVAS